MVYSDSNWLYCISKVCCIFFSFRSVITFLCQYRKTTYCRAYWNFFNLRNFAARIAQFLERVARGTFLSPIAANLMAYQEEVTTPGKSVEQFARRCRGFLHTWWSVAYARGLREHVRSGAIARDTGEKSMGFSRWWFEMCRVRASRWSVPDIREVTAAEDMRAQLYGPSGNKYTYTIVHKYFGHFQLVANNV